MLKPLTICTGFCLLMTSVVFAEGSLRAGAAVASINPEKLPVSMTGGFQDRLAMRVHDPLHARCVILDDGKTRVAIVVCDSCLITRDIYDKSKAEAAKLTGIPTRHMLTAATHTHTAPTAVPLAQCRPDPDYVSYLTNQITQVIVRANAQLQSAKIGWGVVQVAEEINNRRWFVKPPALAPNPFGNTNDQVRMNPPPGSNLLIRPAGPVDPDVTFVSVQDAQGRALSLLANYGLHYVGGIPQGELSADYFGEFARQITDRLGGSKQFVGIMSNGASGDVNNYQFVEPRPRSGAFVRVREVASLVADRVAAANKKVAFGSDINLQMSQVTIPLGVRQPEAAEVTYAEKLLANAADPDRLTKNEVYARETIHFAQTSPRVQIKLQTITIGELAIVAIPCEVFAEVGLEIKRRSPFATTCIIGLANGYNGYLPSPRQHRLGGYETWRSRWSYLETEASTKIVDTVLGQLMKHRQR